MDPAVVEFFEQLEKEVMPGWVFENQDIRVSRGPIEECYLKDGKIFFQMFFLNTTDDQGREIEWPINQCFYCLEDILTVEKVDYEFRFTHRVYGQFLVCPD